MNLLTKISEGYWFYPVTGFVYNKNYIKKYEKYAKTDMGKNILHSRLEIVKLYDKLLDIGVGSCDIINNKKYSKGFDVNPIMIQKLRNGNKWCNIYQDTLDEFDVITFFDSFEHIETPRIILNKITNQTIVISIPIFNNYNDIITSRHFRPDEHYHYFTFLGFLNYMNDLNFKCQYISDIENQLGRNSIFTFVFIKKGKNNENS